MLMPHSLGKFARRLRRGLENALIAISNGIKARREGGDYDRYFPPLQPDYNSVNGSTANEFIAAAIRRKLIFPNVNLSGLPAHGILDTHAGELLQIAYEYAQRHNIQCVARIGYRCEPISLRQLSSLSRRVASAKEFALGFSNSDSAPTFQVRFYVYFIDKGALTCRASSTAIKKVAVDGLRAGFAAVSSDITGYKIDTRCNFPIDAVFTWVNHQDAQWQELIKPYKRNLNWDRYLENDELRYSMRSIAKYAPWIRNIYVLTNCRPPSWLANHPKIHWVDHREVFETRHLPTFNSHAIESYLARIPGLTEHFIYFNDDVFLGRPTAPDHFFTSNGMSIAYLEPYGMVVGDEAADLPDYLRAAIRGRKLIERKFGRSPVQLHLHTPHSIAKSVFLEMETEFPEAFEQVRQNKFRHETDISPASFLYHHYGYQRRMVVRSTVRSVLITVRNYKSYSVEKLAPMQFICINDGGGSAEDRDFQNYKRELLPKLFPWRAEWET